MSDDDYNVYKGQDDKWRGKRQGADRVSVVGESQQDVFKKTRELAKKAEAEVSIHRGDNGKIRAKHSYGNDPKGSPG